MEVKSASDFYSKTKDFDLSDHKVYVTYLLAHFILKDKLKLERLADSEYISWFPFAETNQEKETLDERVRDVQDKISALHERDADMMQEIKDQVEKMEERIEEIIEERIERMSTEMAENMTTITSKLSLLINNLPN
jgi:membrane-associated HD superfamily phosphohydrolase